MDQSRWYSATMHCGLVTIVSLNSFFLQSSSDDTLSLLGDSFPNRCIALLKTIFEELRAAIY